MVNLYIEGTEKKKVCPNCYEYTTWDETTDDWVCSECGAAFDRWGGHRSPEHDQPK